MKISKFGGTSVGSVTALRRSVNLMLQLAAESPTVFVISAMATVTNRLTALAEAAATTDVVNSPAFYELIALHQQTADVLLADPSLFHSFLAAQVKKLRVQLTQVTAARKLSERDFAQIVAYGELWSSRLVAQLLAERGAPALWYDVRQILITDEHYLGAQPQLDELFYRAQQLRPLTAQQLIVTQGFIAATAYGETTILGREGSDYSAALLGAALDATEVQIWTDVAGVMTADPKCIPDAKLLTHLSFLGAAELAKFGAKILHPATLGPAQAANIPVRVLNSFVESIKQIGSTIGAQPSNEQALALKPAVYCLNWYVSKDTLRREIVAFLQSNQNKLLWFALLDTELIIFCEFNQIEFWQEKLNFLTKIAAKEYALLYLLGGKTAHFTIISVMTAAGVLSWGDMAEVQQELKRQHQRLIEKFNQ